ncbi:unnamed protein product [Thelazia callipaeda]|uniref:RNA polymerase-associated protein LEO1 n=1 Tax=Thelazia callipaeda TaxID=103827 RepID=A0A0N5D491_THECL|nr:unnamed protein product [Thelazia callipaeda]
MSSDDSLSEEDSRTGARESVSENESEAEREQQRRSIRSSSSRDTNIDEESVYKREKSSTPERNSSPPSERQRDVIRTSDEGSEASSDSEKHSEIAEDSDASSEREPIPSVSDDSDAASERIPETARDSDGSENDNDDNSSSDANQSSKNQKLRDISLSGSESDKESDSEKKELTEDDIVGPRLYPDPEACTVDSEHLEPTIVEVNTARICPKFTDEKLYFVKFPNFLSIEPRPFDQEHYEDEFDEDDLLDEEGRARLKLRVENTIRWRYILDDYGNIQKQGNSKIVRWSDGTMSLYLGGEIFDATVQPMQLDNHLFLRQGAGLQGHAVFREKLVFRPHSTDSITHRKVTLSMADRSNKSQKVKVLTAVGLNPESKKAEIVRKEEERMRAQNRREAQQRRSRMRPSLGRPGLTANFLEDRDEESEEESIASIKNRYKHGLDDRPLIGHSDSEDSDSKRLHDAKMDSDDSGSDQERKKNKKKKVIIDDDDDDDN